MITTVAPSCSCFNPHPAFRPGATGLAAISKTAITVSILTRPFDRVQQTGQSPPQYHNCFNPHPAFRPGATENISRFDSIMLVSILTRPFDRVQQSIL